MRPQQLRPHRPDLPGAVDRLGTPEALKTEWMREEVLECVCDRPQEAMELIENIPGVKEVALFGKGLHVIVEQADTFQTIIRRRLVENGYGVIGIEKIVPSLEDVFVSLIEARDRVEQAQPEVRK